MSRNAALAAIKAAGTQNDQKAFARLYVENRVSLAAAKNAFSEGQKLAAFAAKRDAAKLETPPMSNAPLTERRKSDRAKMADQLSQRLREAGATVEVELEARREVMICVSASDGTRTATVTVDFDGDSWQPDTHVVTWNTKHCFGTIMGDVNPYHFGKATRVCEGFECLASRLVVDTMLVVSGEAFDLDREDAKRREYEARGWAKHA